MAADDKHAEASVGIDEDDLEENTAGIDDEKFQKLWATYKYRRVCCVPCCRSKPSMDSTLRMHHFPKDHEIARRWEVAVGISRTKALSVCSRHFLPSDYHAGGQRLRKGSVPSIHLKAPPQTVIVGTGDGDDVIYLLVTEPLPQPELFVNAENVEPAVTEAQEPVSIRHPSPIPPSPGFTVVTKMQKEDGRNVIYAGPSPAKRKRGIVITGKRTEPVKPTKAPPRQTSS